MGPEGVETEAGVNLDLSKKYVYNCCFLKHRPKCCLV
jgi:hypothetical protein